MAAFLLPYDPEPEDEAEKHIWMHDKGPELGASLLSRLTEAADGHRDEKRTWLVGQLKAVDPMGHRIKGPYGSPQEAFQANEKLFDKEPAKDKYKIFGPFLTGETDYDKERHVKRVILVLNDDREVCFDGTKYDCVFWTMSAVDKFVVPYYVQVTNLREAEAVRNEFAREDSIAAIHIPGSEIIEPTATTNAVCAADKIPEGTDHTIIGFGVLKWTAGAGSRVMFTPI